MATSITESGRTASISRRARTEMRATERYSERQLRNLLMALEAVPQRRHQRQAPEGAR